MTHSRTKVFACCECSFESNSSSSVVVHTEREHKEAEVAYLDRRPGLDEPLAQITRSCFPAEAFAMRRTPP